MDGNVTIDTPFARLISTTMRLGRVVAANGAQAVIVLDVADAAASSPSLQIGSLVRIPTAQSVVYALVNGLAIPMPKALGEAELRMVELELLGECLVNAQLGQGPLSTRRIDVAGTGRQRLRRHLR
jgi:hypothetical protein